MKDTTASGKSGYEIRLDILIKALELAESAWFTQNSANQAKAEQIGTKEWVIAPDTRVEDALATAKKLYKFVESAR
jgi:hypothetical protein